MKYKTLQFTKKVLKRINNNFKQDSNDLNSRILFHHIPKCGGTSIDDAIRKFYRSNNIANLNPPASLKASQKLGVGLFHYREILLNYFMECEKVQYISGHFPFSSTAYESFKDNFTFLTILREPVSRFLSEYFYNRYKQSNHQAEKSKFPLQEYLDTEFGRTQGCQYVKFLIDPSLSESASITTNDYFSRELIEEAKNNLQKFDIVGCLEYNDLFIKQFEQNFQVKLNVKPRNKNPAPISNIKEETTELIDNKINQLCNPDKEIYEFALEKNI